MTHHEAFALMHYECDDGSESEIIWNSRDGVTPFVINSRSGVPMRHVHWHTDRIMPDYLPRPGQRVFVTATKELVADKVKEYVDFLFDKQDAHVMFESRAAASDYFTREWTRDGSPWLITVPAEGWSAVRQGGVGDNEVATS